MSLRIFNIAAKFNLLTILMIFFSSVGIASFLTYYTVQEKRGEIQKDGKYFSSLIAQRSEYAIYTKDEISLRQIVSTIESSPEIAYIYILNYNMKVLSSNIKDSSIKSKPHSKIINNLVKPTIINSTKNKETKEEFLNVIAPVYVQSNLVFAEPYDEEQPIKDSKEKELLGYIQLGYSLKGVTLFAKKMVFASTLITVALMVLGIIVTLFLTKRITKPVQNLIHASRNIAQGNFTIKVPVDSTDEIGQLANAFNKMSSEVLLREDKLKGTNEQLVTTMKGLSESQHQFQNLIDTSLDPIIIADATGHVTKPNESFLKMIGLQEEETLGKPMYMFAPTEPGTYETIFGDSIEIKEEYFEAAKKHVTTLFETGKIVDRDSYYLTKDNKIILVTENVMFLKNDTGEAVGSFAIIHDITAQKRTEKELINSKVEAENANKAKSNFLANMSHEIRTPMNGIIGFTEMLMDTSLEPEQADYTLTIKESGESLLSIINDILDFSKIEADKIEMDNIDFDLELLAYDVCELIRPRIEKDKVNVLCRVADDLPASIKGDPTRFRQVLLNLMGNAAKFTKQGEIELSFNIDEERDERFLLHVKVRDTGIGIPQSKINTIFELFQQADTSTTREYGGTGLGLSICLKLVKLMEGKLWVESKQGVGSTFHFTAWVKHTDSQKKKRVIPAEIKGKRVLIADDNQTNLDILREVLEKAGMMVVACTNGREAVESLQQCNPSPFDIVILDIMMPEMSGYETARIIRSQFGRKLPLIAFSSAIEGSANKCADAGFDGFLPKPINRIKLLNMIAQLLGTSTNEQQVKTNIVTQYSIREEAKLSVSILIAEDNPVNQKLAVNLLKKAGYSVEVANNGRKAVDMYCETPEAFDLILMDVQMPKLNGLEATQELRDKGFNKLPIIAMTANAMKGDREKCIAAGMNDYITKPIKRDIVFSVLNKWVIERNSQPLCDDGSAVS